MTLAEELKAYTAENHQLLEKKLVAKMRAMRSKQHYIDVLAVFYSYFGGLEHLINNHLQSDKIPDHQLRRKAGLLAGDMESLGAKLPELASAYFLPEITGHHEALGAMYVMEGSTLGGKIISQMVRKQLGLTEGLSFFHGYGDRTPDMWQRFQEILNQPENLPGAATLTSANDTFLKFSSWFDLNS